MDDFIRINQPRIYKLNDILAMIRKSADSQGVSGSEIRALLQGVKIGIPAPGVVVSDAERQEIIKAGPGPVKPAPAVPMAETPHYHRIGVFVDNLPAEHLENYIEYIVGRLCELAAIAPNVRRAPASVYKQRK